MANCERELLRALVKITDYISDIELRKMLFIFSNEIKREGYSDRIPIGTLDFFQQLLDRGIIDSQNLSKLIETLDDVGSHRAAQYLKDYQLQRLQSVSTSSATEKQKSLLDAVCGDNESDKQATETVDHDIEERLIDLQQEYLLNNNIRSKSTINTKTNTKIIGKKDFIYLIIFLIYTIILILLICFTIIKLYGQTKSSLIDKKNLDNQNRFCQPNSYEPYFIKSHYTGKSIGVESNSNDQGDKQNQSCIYQWYFIPLQTRDKEEVYVIQSVYNHKVFEVSNENKIHLANINMKNAEQWFRLIYVHQENLCQITSLTMNKILDEISQTDLVINKEESFFNKQKTSWQLIPFDKDRRDNQLTNCAYIPSINDLTLIKFGQIFGYGNDFDKDDSKQFQLTISHYINSISLTLSDWLNSIEFIYSSSSLLNKNSSKLTRIYSTRVVHNNNKYRNETFNVTETNPNERINRVDIIINQQKNDSINSSSYIIGIRFHTTFDRTSPFYGSQQGQLLIETYPGFILGYVRSEGYIHIERLQFIWYKV